MLTLDYGTFTHNLSEHQQSRVHIRTEKKCSNESLELNWNRNCIEVYMSDDNYKLIIGKLSFMRLRTLNNICDLISMLIQSIRHSKGAEEKYSSKLALDSYPILPETYKDTPKAISFVKKDLALIYRVKRVDLQSLA